MEESKSKVRFLSLQALLILLAFWKIVFTDEYTYFWGLDIAGQYYPWYQFAGSSWKSGSAPLWDPYSRAGRLFFDEMQAGAFYPINLILFWFPARNGGVDLRSMDLSIPLSSLIACTGQYAFLRFLGIGSPGSLVGAVVFGLGGYTAYIVGHQAIFQGVIWLPWISLWFLRALGSHGVTCLRNCLLSGFFLGLSILAGHIQPPAHICLILGFFALSAALSRKINSVERRKAIGALVMTIAFAVLIAAVQLLPTYIYAKSAYRWLTGHRLEPLQRIPFDWQGVWSPAEYLSLLVPSATDHKYYLGIATLVLAIYGAMVSDHVHKSLFAILTLLSFLYSWGQISSVYSTVYLLTPFIEKIPEAGRAFFIFQFSVATLAALGTDVLCNPIRKTLRRRFTLISNLILGSSWSILIALLGVGLFRALETQPVGHQSFIGESMAGVFLFFVSGIVMLRKYRFYRLRFFRVAITFVISFDLVSFVQAHTPVKDDQSADRMYAETKTTAFLRSLSGFFRVMELDDSLPPNFGDAYRIESIFGYGASLRKDYMDFLDSYSLERKAMRMLNVKYYISRKSVPSLKSIHIDEHTGVGVYEDVLALPRLGFVKADPVSIQRGEVLHLGEGLLLETLTKRVDGKSLPVVPQEKLRIVSYTANQVVVHVETDVPGYLWLSELAYPGWRVYVDGREEPLLISDRIFRAVHLNTGKHRVEFRFRPGELYAGVSITVLAAVGLVSTIWATVVHQVARDASGVRGRC